MQAQQIDISKIPKLELLVNNQQLINCIKQLHFHSKTQEKHLTKAKTEIQGKVDNSKLSNCFELLTAIDIDPNLLKNIKNSKAQKQDSDEVNRKTYQFMGKLQQMSDCLGYLMKFATTLDKKISSVTADTKSIINEKTNSLQEQLDEFKKSQNKENRALFEKDQLNLEKYEDKLREVTSQTLWKINDCHVKLDDRVNEQMVKDYVKEVEGKIMTKVKESLIKTNIDPQRIQDIENKILRNEKNTSSKITQVNAKLSALSEHVEHSMLSIKAFNQEKIEIDKKMQNVSSSLYECLRKTSNIELELKNNHQKEMEMATSIEGLSKQTDRMRAILNNLKLSDQFQELMSKLDPHKICEMDNSINNLQLRTQKLQKQFKTTSDLVQKIQSKTQFCSLLKTQQKTNSTLTRQDVNNIVLQYFTNTQYSKKLQTLEAQFLQTKGYTEMINDLNKRFAQFEKRNDRQSLVHELRGLQEYIKKEILITNNRVGQLESQMEAKKRPVSAGKTTTGNLATSVSFKKLVPVNCISCYPNSFERKINAGKY